MKNSTKFKIVKWVEKILGYKHPPVQIPIIKERKIQELNVEFILFEYEAKHRVKEMVIHRISNELMKLDAIDYIVEPDKENAYLVKARVFFIEPFEKWLK